MRFQIDLPFPPIQSPHLDAVTDAERECAEWLTSPTLGLGLPSEVVDGLLDLTMATVAADFCAVMPQPDLGLLHILLIWSVLIDDFFDGPYGKDPTLAKDAVSQLTAVITVPPAPPPPSTWPLVTATADVWARITTNASTSWIHHTAARLRTWLNVFVVEAHMRRQNTIPNPTTYIPTRRTAIAMDMYADLTERACDFELPEYLRTSSVVKGMHECLCDIVGFTNDVRSLELETARGDNTNLVLVLAAHKDCSYDHAIHQISTLVLQACDRFNTLATTLPSLACDTNDQNIAHRYATMVRDQAQTHEAWCQRTNRYGPTPPTGTDLRE